jgi:hypothetical protein
VFDKTEQSVAELLSFTDKKNGECGLSGYITLLLLSFCFAYTLTLKVEEVCSSRMSGCLLTTQH